MKCDYSDCDNEATKEWWTKDWKNRPYVLHLCKQHYDEDMELMKEFDKEKPTKQIIEEGLEVLKRIKERR